jgi:hypothetical protein
MSSVPKSSDDKPLGVEAPRAGLPHPGGLTTDRSTPSTLVVMYGGSPSLLLDACHHTVNFYDDEADLVTDVARFLAEDLNGDEAAVVSATQAHRDAIDATLERRLTDGRGGHGSARYVSLDAGCPFRVSVRRCESDVRLEVHDLSPARPRRRAAAVHAIGGRGVAVVAALSTRWGTERVPDGKVVWAELARSR